jgi:hypothetical protein
MNPRKVRGGGGILIGEWNLFLFTTNSIVNSKAETAWSRRRRLEFTLNFEKAESSQRLDLNRFFA